MKKYYLELTGDEIIPLMAIVDCDVMSMKLERKGVLEKGMLKNMKSIQKKIRKSYRSKK